MLGSVLLVAVMISCLLLHPVSYALLFAYGLAVMMHEYYAMAFGKGRHTALRVAMAAFCVIFFLACFVIKYCNIRALFLLLTFPILIIYLCATMLDKDGRTEQLPVVALCFPVVYMLPSFVATNMLLFEKGGAYNPYLYIAVTVLVWMSDIGAFATGMTFGQKPDSPKLAPAISPNKSWAGVAGCVLFTFATAVCFHLFGWFDLRLWHWLVIAAIVVVFGILGDLFESVIKRHYGYKDSGQIVVGHGGLLDRFDGGLFSVPVVAVFLVLAGVIY